MEGGVRDDREIEEDVGEVKGHLLLKDQGKEDSYVDQE